MKKSILFVLFLIGQILAITLTAIAQDYTIIQLTDNNRSDYNPQINDNNQVAWPGGVLPLNDSQGDELYFYDNSEIYQITNNSLQDHGVKINNNWINNNGQLLWSQSDLDGSNEDLFLFDSEVITQLTDNGTLKNVGGFNDSGFVVWEEYPSSFLYDGTSITKFEAYLEDYPDASIVLSNPKINNKGQVVLSGRLNYGSKIAGLAVFLYSNSALDKVIGLSPFPFFSVAPQILIRALNSGHML